MRWRCHRATVASVGIVAWASGRPTPRSGGVAGGSGREVYSLNELLFECVVWVVGHAKDDVAHENGTK